LAVGTAGIDGAYRCFADEQELGALVEEAITARDSRLLHACAALEAIVHGRAFPGAFHMALARLLVGPAARLPEEVTGQLTAPAAEAGAEER
jgi:hypothetical protein